MELLDGYRIAYNRLNEPYERMFNGAPYVFNPHEKRILPEEVALFLRANSLLSWEPTEDASLRAIVLNGDPDFEQPYEGQKPTELLDRSVDDNYVQRPSLTGEKTHAVQIPVKGSKADFRRP